MHHSDLCQDQPAHRSETSHELVRWILTEGRIAAIGEDPAQETGRPARFINALCRRLVSAGVPLSRVTVYAATLHPEVSGFGWRWWRDGRLIEEVRIAQGTELSQEFRQSPVRSTIEQGATLRCRLDGSQDEFPLLQKFRADGCTDYVAVPLNRIGGRFPVVAWATDRAGGFAAGQHRWARSGGTTGAILESAPLPAQAEAGFWLTSFRELQDAQEPPAVLKHRAAQAVQRLAQRPEPGQGPPRAGELPEGSQAHPIPAQAQARPSTPARP